jgi:hypothetical protein
MADALDELNARIAELRGNLAFVALAARLRPRIGDAIRWEAGVEVVQLAREFMNSATVRLEGVLGSLFVALMASLERYVRMLVIQAVEKQAELAKTYDEVPPTLANRNLVLTGRVLANIDAPREHITIDIESMISNLASCKRGNSAFRLNVQAFSTTVTGVSPGVVEEALKAAGVPEWWDGVGGSAKLAGLLGTRGPRDTGNRARERLKELCRWRNHLAHGGDEEVALSEAQLLEAIDFVVLFSDALNRSVQKHLQRR